MWIAPLLAAIAAAPSPSPADGPAPPEIAPREVLVARVPGGGGRTPIAVDPVAAALVRSGRLDPKPGDPIGSTPGGPAWEVAKAEPDGSFRLRGGYAYASIPSDRDRVLILEATGHSAAFVDGEPRAGDPYGYGYVRLPVAIRAGGGGLLLAASGRGPLRFRLIEPKGRATIDGADATLPDLVAGEARPGDEPMLGAVVVVNASADPLEGAVIEAEGVGGAPGLATPIPTVPPLAARKVGFGFRVGGEPTAGADVPLKLALKLCDGGAAVDGASVKLGVVAAGRARKVTFRSAIDGSVQYYGLVPAGGEGHGPPPGRKPGLILSLHGASVEGIGQARVYRPKPWAHVVAPTNRRPYGFDWEDWGRLDALEVLGIASAALEADPRRTYLTGHSMGGHGTWHLGAHFAGRFAAIAPSAGWLSFASYAAGRGGNNAPAAAVDPVGSIVRRAASPSDTLALFRNLAGVGVYVLHGDADDNVPVGQARAARADLGQFHPDLAYYERPGAGHWWGDECVDWPPLVDFLDRHEIPEPAAIRRVDFRTASPGISDRMHWASIQAQARPFELSTVALDSDPDARSIAGTTANVARLALDLGHLKPGGPAAVTLDGQKLDGLPEPAPGARLWLARAADGAWSRIDPPPPSLKNPGRSGPFKEAFRNRMIFVVGTAGTPEETARARARARFDAETFWYRGNGSVDIVADAAFDPKDEPDRNVILYGNADTNRAWAPLLGDGPVRVDRSGVRVGSKSVAGPGLACLFVRPRPGSDRASVAAVAGTGPEGARLTQRLPYFASGVAYPDLVVAGPAGEGFGFVGAGYFGDDWGVESGEFAWRE